MLKSAAVAGAALVLPNRSIAKTSARSDYWQPEESLPHQATFMQWPVNSTIHSNREFLLDLQASIADVANTISAFEPVILLMDKRFKASARSMLSENIEIWDIPTDDLWARDSGPCFVRNTAGELAVRHFNFNGWGNKQLHDVDGHVAARVAERMGLPLLDNGLVGEPGGIEFDGHGTLIGHESSWINNNRNLGTKDEVSELLKEAYGAHKIIWAPGLVDMDITDYHIDSLARFVSEGRILIQLPGEVYDGDVWSQSAHDTYDTLKNATDANGNKFEIDFLPEPTTPRVQSGDFVASYANYYVCNNAVVSAQFGDEETDANAKQKLSELYPTREVVTLNIDPIGEVGGGIHCATQQLPSLEQR